MTFGACRGSHGSNKSSIFEGPVLMSPGPEIKVSSTLGQTGTAIEQ